jgi:hypothetical protein
VESLALIERFERERRRLCIALSLIVHSLIVHSLIVHSLADSKADDKL